MDVIDDDILRLILERINSLDLTRAASTCKRWRRTIADAIFLRRFRSLHAPTVAGDYYNDYLFEPTTGRSGGTVFVPSSSIAARHFSLDFLPGGAEPWSVLDSRGSLLLVHRESHWKFPHIAVCEPLTQRYMGIPYPSGYCSFTCRFRGAYLVDGDDDEAGCRIGMSNFRVLRALQRDRWEEEFYSRDRFSRYGKHQSSVFTVAGAGMSNFTGLCALQRGRREDELYSRDGLSRHVFVLTVAGAAGWSWTERAMYCEIPPTQLVLGRAGGSWYFHNGGGTLVVLDGSTGEFSSSVFPGTEDWGPNMWRSNFCFTESRDGEPRIVTVFGDSVRVFARLNDGEWAPEKRTLLSEATRCLPAGYQPPSFHQSHYIASKGTGFVVLSPRVADRDRWRFSVETMEVAPVEEDEGDMTGRTAHPCELPWPPVLRACLD